MELRFYNTLCRRVEPFIPLVEGRAGIYACGPTVYNYAHIGNMRTYVFEDLLRRVLEYAGYSVNHVMNVTDVGHLTDDADDGEDKVEKSARERGMDVWEVSRYYTEAFFKDIARLNILPPTTRCVATEHIGEMIALIRRLEDRGLTYRSEGNVYFDIGKFSSYGELALLDRQSLMDGARISPDPGKNNPRDFVLWFTNSKFKNQVMQWDSPWGRGYPGWHIECSAMSMKYLGERFDIHCGGTDHIPIHHTNEIAQSEGATGTKWVNYWLHGEFLILQDKKMSKSSGNFLTLSSLEESGYSPLDYRYFCLGGHYRSQLLFTIESMNAAKSARRKLNARVLDLKAEGGEPTQRDELSADAATALLRFEQHLSNDLGLPRALSEAWGVVKATGIPPADRLTCIMEMDRVLGLGLGELSTEDSRRATLSDEVDRLLQDRSVAREKRDYVRADEIRTRLSELNIDVRDTPDGPVWGFTD